MDMPKWRETAQEMMPELADDISEAESPYILWMLYLRRAFEMAYEASPRDESIIARVYAYADWCARAPRGETASDDLLTCVAVCFWEHIPEHPAARADMPRWFTLEQVLGMREILSYRVGEQGFAAIEEVFRQHARLHDRTPPGVNPDS